MFRYTKKTNKNIQCIDNGGELSKFYMMLLKYQQNHPNFNYKRIMLKLYPRIELDSLEIKK